MQLFEYTSVKQKEKNAQKKHNKHREKKVYLQLKASYKDFFFLFKLWGI